MSTAYRSTSELHRGPLGRVGLSEALAPQTAPLVAVQSFEAGTKLWTKGAGAPMAPHHGRTGFGIHRNIQQRVHPIAIWRQGAWFGEQSIINRKPSYYRLCA